MPKRIHIVTILLLLINFITNAQWSIDVTNFYYSLQPSPIGVRFIEYNTSGISTGLGIKYNFLNNKTFNFQTGFIVNSFRSKVFMSSPFENTFNRPPLFSDERVYTVMGIPLTIENAFKIKSKTLLISYGVVLNRVANTYLKSFASTPYWDYQEDRNFKVEFSSTGLTNSQFVISLPASIYINPLNFDRIFVGIYFNIFTKQLKLNMFEYFVQDFDTDEVFQDKIFLSSRIDMIGISLKYIIKK